MKRALALLVCLAACANHDHGGGGDSGMLVVSPATSTLVLVDGSAASEPFTATWIDASGSATDVTAETVFGAAEPLGSFTGAMLTAVAAGDVPITATYAAGSNTLLGSADVTVKLQGVRVDPSLDPNTPNLFTGATEDPSRVPSIVYPPVGAIMPRNIGDFEVHWTDASSNNVFEVSLESAYVDLRVYVPGGNGNAAAGADASWTAFTPDEWTAAIGVTSNLTYRVRGADSNSPGTVGSAPLQGVDLSNEDMNGGIYYWNSTEGGSDSPEGIMRHDMSRPQEPAEIYEMAGSDAPIDGGHTCIACHVLSRDGTQMAVTFDGGDGQSDQLDVAMQTFQGGSNAWNFATYTPDNAQLLTVEGGQLSVRDATTQSVLSTMTDETEATHPDLSPDGTKLVYVRKGGSGVADWSFDGGQIVMRSYDETTATFGSDVTVLVPTDAGDAYNNYYPSFSPDGQWILFCRSADNTESGSYNNSSAGTWVVAARAGAAPVELAAANATGALTNSWPRWAPFQLTIGTTAKPLYWVTFSSKRDFGVRLVGTGKPQLWMSPFFPDDAATGADPSAPAFWLPFQNIDSSNHIAQWTQQVIGIQ